MVCFPLLPKNTFERMTTGYALYHSIHFKLEILNLFRSSVCKTKTHRQKFTGKTQRYSTSGSLYKKKQITTKY